ncbi:glutathionylspermidine synthase family protein [Luteimonas sp. MJ250]|uniref:glutathionylspermidine synthase family protein n=1 Tax=Luteimonas sp. MJ250 TaxID=3129236 RepID=UPI0031BB538E
MRRVPIEARPDWRRRAEDCGFAFHTIDGDAYWDESVYYAFTLQQVEDDIEDPTAELHAMAMDLAGEAAGSQELMERLAIPAHAQDQIAESWRRRDPHLYGRIDLAYDGRGPAKLYEFNYDTPTSLFEAAFFQWDWLERQREAGALAPGADQFNAIHEALVARFIEIGSRLPLPLYFAASQGSPEDQGTVDYLRDCAAQAGIESGSVAMEDIGLSADGRFTAGDDVLIASLFKLYPLEDLFADEFAQALPGSGLRLLEPAWKLLLSNKGALPLLWDRHRGHPNLLPAEFDDGGALPPGWVRKPLFSREGANIEMHFADGRTLQQPGPYGGPSIRQALHPLPEHGAAYPLIGSWVVGDLACGMGIREDDSPITRDSARFVPHAIVGDGRGQRMVLEA